MKILTERQYEKVINEAINRFIERRDAEKTNNRLRDVEEQLKCIRGEIEGLKSRIGVIEELYLPLEKAKSPRFSEAITVPLVTTPAVIREDKP